MSADRAWYAPGPGVPPPLPPRSPRPAQPMSYSPAYYAQHGSLPPPPPGPPPRSPGLAPVHSDVPPPIPPRPPGFESPALRVQGSASTPAAPPGVPSSHSIASSRPVMSANLPWLSQEPDNAPFYPQPGVPSTYKSDAPVIYQPPEPTIGPQSGGPLMQPSGLSPQASQPQALISGVADNFSKLNLSEGPPITSSNAQQWAYGEYPPPPTHTPGTYNTSPSPGTTHSTTSPSTASGASSCQTDSYPPPSTSTSSAPSVVLPQMNIPSSHISIIPPTEQHFRLPSVSAQRATEPQSYVPYNPRTFSNQPQESRPEPTNTSPTPPQSSESLDNQGNTLASSNQRASPFPSSQAGASPRGEPMIGDIGFSTSSRPEAVTACIDTLVTFSTTWYTHSSAPAYTICSRCYVDHIYPSRFRAMFSGNLLDDGKPRLCRFSKPRMSKHLFPEAVSQGSLQNVLDWMNRRSMITECKGVQGAKVSENIKWFNTRNGDIPHFLACEACYEDRCLTNSFASQFKPSTDLQGDNDIWSCDMAIPFIDRAYREFGKSDAWTTFSEEAAIRLHQVPGCPGQDAVSTRGRKWYQPKNNDPDGLVICAACYCDQVLLTTDTGMWSEAVELSERFDIKATCDLAQFNALTSMLVSQDHNDFSIFWTAIKETARHPRCDSKGTKNATWYTLPSHPSNFGVCGACHAGLVTPLGLKDFFVINKDVPPDATLLCCFNPGHPRKSGMLQKLLELYWLHKPHGLEQYAIDYASTPTCKKDEDFKNAVWYGWNDCTICPDCYLEFVKGTTLADKMPLQSTLKSDSHMCEMYSPRMRKLYLEACEKGDPSELLQYSAYRRSVYLETIPECRMLLFQAKMNQRQQSMLNTTASFYTHLGAMQEISMPSVYTYSSPGLGGGFHNQHEIQGAAYAKQGWNTFVNGQSFITNATFRVKELEKRWRAVE